MLGPDTVLEWEAGIAIADAISDALIYYAPTIARALLATGIVATTASLKSDSTDCPDKAKEKEEEESTSNKNLPILYVSRALTPETAQHIEDAQSQRPDWIILTYNGKSDPLTDLNRLEAMVDVPLSPSGWRDEYPFASTLEGGSGSSVRYVPAWEQRIQAGQLSAFYRYVLKGKPAEFIVVVGP